jgi:hypothetical protein
MPPKRRLCHFHIFDSMLQSRGENSSTPSRYLILNNVPKMETKTYIQSVIKYWRQVTGSSGMVSSQSSQTSLNFFGSSVMTPSTSLWMLQRIHFSSFTVHRNICRSAALTSAKNLAPKGPIMIFWSMLKETFGTFRKRRA